MMTDVEPGRCCALVMRWHHQSRYYEAHLRQDLFGWVVVRYWGGIGRAGGRMKSDPVPDFVDGLRRIHEVASRRRKRRYDCDYAFCVLGSS